MRTRKTVKRSDKSERAMGVATVKMVRPRRWNERCGRGCLIAELARAPQILSAPLPADMPMNFKVGEELAKLDAAG